MPTRLLMIAPYPVLPLVAGGKIRIVKLARSLAQAGLEVTICAPFHFPQHRARHAAEPFRLVAVKYPPFALHHLLTGRPLPYGYLISFHPGYRWLLGDLLRCHDLIQLEHPAFVDLLESEAAAGKPVIYDAQNVEFDYVRSECPSPGVAERAGRRLHELEGRLIRRAEHVFACSEPDRQRFLSLYAPPAERLSLLPNGIDSAEPPPAADEAGVPPRFPELARFRRWAIFSGSDVEHNRVALRYILEDLAPRLAEDCAFVIHGRCSRSLRAATAANVFLDPEGDDLALYRSPRSVAIHPVDQGSGTNLKVLHCLALGFPMLSTDFGMRGLEDLRPYVTVAARADFAARLRAEPERRPGVEEALRAYEWKQIAARAEAVYAELLSRSREKSGAVPGGPR